MTHVLFLIDLKKMLIPSRESIIQKIQGDFIHAHI